MLYLCTTCGGTLRNNGEDGRWKRRRRPNSAPAAGRRRAAFFDGGSGDDGDGRSIGGNNLLSAQHPAEGWNNNESIAVDMSLTDGESPRLLVGGGGRRGGDTSTTRLRYAHCARTIQHAYQNFRHRQYLRDWAFSVVRQQRSDSFGWADAPLRELASTTLGRDFVYKRYRRPCPVSSFQPRAAILLRLKKEKEKITCRMNHIVPQFPPLKHLPYHWLYPRSAFLTEILLMNVYLQQCLVHLMLNAAPRPLTRSVSFLRQLCRWLTRRVKSMRRTKHRVLCRVAAVTMQSAARAASARARCSALRAARLRLWMDRVALLYADDAAIATAGDVEDDNSPSPAAVQLLREMNAPPPPPSQQSLQMPPKYAAGDVFRGGDGGGGIGKKTSTISSSSRWRALAEALAPRMGRPPPGCPAALDVDWGEWGVGLSLVFPPSPPRCVM